MMTSPEEDPPAIEEGNAMADESQNNSTWTTEEEKQQDATDVTPEIYTVDGEIGSYHGDSHIAMRMSAECKGGLQNVDKTHPQIWALLPKGYEYHICAIEIPDPCHPEHYKIGLRLRIDTEQAMNEWMEEYQRESFTGWRIGHGNRKSKAVRILYQKNYKCKHNIFFRKDKPTKRQIDHTLTWRGSQHTGCPAKMNVAIRVHVKGISKNRVSRGKDVHMPDFPAMVSICHTHNHDTQSEYALRFRAVNKEVEHFYIDLFKAGHSALTAHSFVMWKRWAEYGADFDKMILDRAYTPDIAFVYRIFYRMLRERKPHLLKPRKVKKPENGILSNGSALTTVDTTAPPHIDTSSSTATINDRLGTDVIMEEDEGEVSPAKKTRLDADAVNKEANSDSADPNSSMLPLDVSSTVTDSETLNDSSQLDNNAAMSEMTFAGEEEEEEEAQRDFFAHGHKKRIPGSNRKRKSTVDLKELYEDLEKLVSKHVVETHPAQAHLARITGDRDDMIIAICTPLMRRAHTETTVSGEVCILDGTFQSFGQGMCYVISFMVPSNAGGVPLGFLVLSSMDQVFITQGLELFKMLIPEEAFGGRGRDGPAYFLTDEEHFKGDILQAAFPHSNVLISPYHLILMAWRWLVDPKRRIEPGDLSALVNLVRELVGCQSAEEIQTLHLKILGSEINDKYREFAPYVIDAIVNRWSEWSLPADHPIHRIGVGVQPWEKVMNCLRDRVLMKGRHFNILQMTHFLLYGVDAVYERNLVNGCQNVPSNVSFTPVFFDTTIPRDGIKQLNSMDFLVNPKSKSSVGLLSVNATLGVCSCISGKSGYFCAHMAAVLKYYDLPSNCKLPFHCGREKYQIYKVATGEKIIHEQLTETMQQLSQVVEANPSSLTDPIRHFIQQIQRADSTANLGKALKNFTVLTKEEEEEEEQRAREERERLEREKEEEEKKERRRREEEEEARKAEELRQQEVAAEQQRNEEKRRLKEAETEQLKLANNKDGKTDASWLLSQDTVLVVTAPQASSPKISQRDTMRHKGVLPGRTERNPIMTPGRAVTRGVSRMLTNIETNKKEASSKRKPKQSPTDSPAPKSTVLQEASRQMKELAASNAKEKNLVLLVSEKGGMLLKGTAATMADLGRVLVINRPITDQQVGLLMVKDSDGVKKGVSKRGKKGKS